MLNGILGEEHPGKGNSYRLRGKDEKWRGHHKWMEMGHEGQCKKQREAVNHMRLTDDDERS